MAVSKDLLDILVCPLCKAPVHLVHYETGLKCEQCKRVYPIREDIPAAKITAPIRELFLGSISTPEQLS